MLIILINTKSFLIFINNRNFWEFLKKYKKHIKKNKKYSLQNGDYSKKQPRKS